MLFAQYLYVFAQILVVFEHTFASIWELRYTSKIVLRHISLHNSQLRKNVCKLAWLLLIMITYMTITEIAKLIGQPCETYVSLGGKQYAVTGVITDVKHAYGNTRYQVKIDGQDATGWTETVILEERK